jgi:hypothetical protein
MADNINLNPGTGGDTVRTVDKAGAETQVVLLDIGGLGAESLFTGAVSLNAALPAGANTIGNVNVVGTVPVSNAGLTNLDVALSTRLKPADTLAGVTLVGAVTSITNPVAVTQSGAWSTGRTWTLGSGTDSITTVPSGTQTVTGTVTANQGGAPWSENISQWGGAATSLGQKASTASVPVALASDGLGSSVGTPMFISGSISATSAATATNSEPQYAEAASAALSQNLNGQLRVIEDIQPTILNTMQNILLEIRVMNTVLHQTLNCRDDLDSLRRDAFYINSSMVN